MTQIDHQKYLLVDTDDPGAIAVEAPERSLTWDQLEQRARQLANALQGSGIGAGVVWGVLAHNRAEWPEFYLGNGRAGARLVTLNWHLTASELSDLIVASKAMLIVVEPGLVDRVREVAEHNNVQLIVLGQGYEAWLDEAGDQPLTERRVGSPMLFTGGTTGKSKGVNRSDQKGNASDWAMIWDGWASLVRMPVEGPMLLSTPLYHAFGMAAAAAGLAAGKKLVIAPKFDPEQTLALIEEHRITCAPMVPTQFIRLLKLDQDQRDRYDLTSLRWVIHTAAPCPPWVKRAMIDWFGPVIYEFYGSSEGTGPAVCDSHEWLAHPGTVGRATTKIEYSIVDEAGHDLGAGETGTIYCKRSDGTPEYQGDPDKTSAMILPDGRFTVGDLGWLDDDGYLFLADRRVDLIITGGANVYPAEIEGVLTEHPLVADAAVFGIPDPEWGQQIKAVVEPISGADLDPADLRTFAAERLASFKLPKTFDIAETLPREAHGKLKKRVLRDPYWIDTRAPNKEQR